MDEDRVLILDEDQKRRGRIVHFLSRLALDVESAASFSEASRLLRGSDSYSTIVASQMPFNVHYMKTLRTLKSLRPHLSIILLSNIQTPELAIALFKEGLVDHIASPDNLGGIFSAIQNELNKKENARKDQAFMESLKKLKSSQQKNIKRVLDLEEIYNTTLENLMTALDLRDVETFGHSRSVARYSQVLAEILGIKDKNALDNIRKGALLHDIGKIAIPDSILKKPFSLSPLEWKKVKLHPSLGFGLVKEIKLVKEVGDIVLFHHERYDGTGYPRHLKRENIPFEARIFALADALDAITSHRPYRKERDFRAAKKEIQDNSGSQFDPKVVESFCSLSLDQWKKIRYETTRLSELYKDMIEVQKL